MLVNQSELTKAKDISPHVSDPYVTHLLCVVERLPGRVLATRPVQTVEVRLRAPGIGRQNIDIDDS